MAPTMHRNSILNALPSSEQEIVRRYLEPVDLHRKQSLGEIGRTIEHVYFPTQGVISVLTYFADGSSVETAAIGNEGFVGVGVFLGTPIMRDQAFVQVEGAGYRMAAKDLELCCSQTEHLPQLLKRYTSALLRLLAQTAACNRRHSIEERCARWLLTTHDRAGRNTFHLTQQFLSQMLGVRRATVSAVANALQKAGRIEYSRGRLTILDRTGLQSEACECYDVIRNEFARAYGVVEAPLVAR